MDSLILRRERPEDFDFVENLTREAFWDIYAPGCDEHWVLHRLRKSPEFIPELDWVAVENDRIVGHIAYSRAKILDEKGKAHEVLTFGPISVDPARQGQGIGSLMIRHTVSLAKEMGFSGIIIFGNPGYYHRFGFRDAREFGITTADGENFEAFMVLELGPASMKDIHGKLELSEAFFTDRAETEEFDSHFPPREKHVTDTQLK